MFVQYLVFVCCLTYICIQYLALIWYGPVVKFFKTFPLPTLTNWIITNCWSSSSYMHTQLKLYKWVIKYMYTISGWRDRWAIKSNGQTSDKQYGRSLHFCIISRNWRGNPETQVALDTRCSTKTTKKQYGKLKKWATWTPSK